MKQVLLIEDNADHARLIIERCAAEPNLNIDLDWANSLPIAYDILQRTSPDIILISMLLNGKPVSNALDEIRLTSPHSYIMALSSDGKADRAASAIRSGVDEYLLKESSTLDALPQILINWCAKPRRSKQTEEIGNSKLVISKLYNLLGELSDLSSEVDEVKEEFITQQLAATVRRIERVIHQMRSED